MKQIKILVPRFGPRARWKKGDVLTVGKHLTAADAARLVEAGEAEDVTPADAPAAASGKGKR